MLLEVGGEVGERWKVRRFSSWRAKEHPRWRDAGDRRARGGWRWTERWKGGAGVESESIEKGGDSLVRGAVRQNLPPNASGLTVAACLS